MRDVAHIEEPGNAHMILVLINQIVRDHLDELDM